MCLPIQGKFVNIYNPDVNNAPDINILSNSMRQFSFNAPWAHGTFLTSSLQVCLIFENAMETFLFFNLMVLSIFLMTQQFLYTDGGATGAWRDHVHPRRLVACGAQHGRDDRCYPELL